MRLTAIIFSALLLLTLSRDTNGSAVEINTTSLYTDSAVEELFLSNMTEALNSTHRVWAVEYYAHVCPHCQAYAKIWKEVANKLQGGKGF